MRVTTSSWLGFASVALACVPTAWGADPPARISYQAVLRNGADAPLTGSYSMEFRFYTLDVGGDEILRDSHAVVPVTGGLFSVALGGGTLADGTGPGTYSSLDAVFRDHSSVWLEVRVGAETLAPRTPVQSAAYALNATNLAGKPAGDFLDTSATTQVKAGSLVLGSAPPSGSGVGIEAATPNGGAYFFDTDGTAVAMIGSGPNGIVAVGQGTGGYFADSNGSSVAYVASGDKGIDASGHEVGGHFSDGDSGSDARIAFGGRGVQATGPEAGGYFASAYGTGEAYAGYGSYGIQGSGNTAGGYFTDKDGGSGYAYLGYGDFGVEARASVKGGYFTNATYPSNTSLAYFGWGIYSVGASPYGGGYFGTSGSGIAQLAVSDRGVEGYGHQAGGYFEDYDSSGYAYAGYFDYGILGYGNSAGAYFTDLNGAGSSYVGDGNTGIRARGTYGTGNTGEAGHFKDTAYTGEATVADGDTGIVGIGSFAGGIFRHCAAGTPTCTGTDNETQLATPTSAISSAAPKNFVQNHPYDPAKIVVYTSLEGDEVGTYTRGTGRLEHGMARIPLSESFAWVTNPDIGLTAHVTPRGGWADLYVESLSSTELVVRSSDGRGQDAAFDYVVMGLRIGFEEASVVRDRDVDAYLPSMAPHEEVYRSHPELRRLNALERFRTMRERSGEAREVDLARSKELLAAIGVYDPAVHGMPKGRLLTGPEVAVVTEDADPTGPARPTAVRLGPPSAPSEVVQASEASSASQTIQGPVAPETPRQVRTAYELVPAVGEVAPGDVLVLDPLVDGAVAASETAADPLVVGCAAAPADGEEIAVPSGQAALAASRVVLCRADASFGAIAVGDLLTTSPTPAHAMRAGEVAPGAILGKAAEPLDRGTALIRVVVTLR